MRCPNPGIAKKGKGKGEGGRANTFQDLHIGFILDLVTNVCDNFGDKFCDH